MLITLQNVRIAFCQDLFKAAYFSSSPKAGEVPKFSSTFILPKDHAQFSEIEKVMKYVAKEKWGAKAPAVYKALKASGKLCFRSGEDKAEYDGFEGNYYIASSDETKPVIKDNKKVILTGSEGIIYAGCYVHAILDIWPQDNSWGKRINAKLKGVMFYKNGDAFSSSAPIDESAFDDLAVDEGDIEEDIFA